MKKIIDCTPASRLILVEMLDAQEVLGTSLAIPGEKVDVGSPQGRILKIGPQIDETWGFKEGDRVLLQGSFVPCPPYGESAERGLLEPHMIKAVLIESDE